MVLRLSLAQCVLRCRFFMALSEQTHALGCALGLRRITCPSTYKIIFSRETATPLPLCKPSQEAYLMNAASAPSTIPPNSGWYTPITSIKVIGSRSSDRPYKNTARRPFGNVSLFGDKKLSSVGTSTAKLQCWTNGPK